MDGEKFQRGSGEIPWVCEGERFENPTGPETIGLDLASSFRSQSLIEESEIGEEPVKSDRTR